MTADRFLFSVLLVACAALAALALAEPAPAAAPVVQLERVTITASSLDSPRQIAGNTAAADTTTTLR